MNCRYCKRDLSKAAVAFNTPYGTFCDHDCKSDFELGYKPKERNIMNKKCGVCKDDLVVGDLCGYMLDGTPAHQTCLSKAFNLPDTCCDVCGKEVVAFYKDNYAVCGHDCASNIKDSINPSHYKSHASGIECIQVTEHMSFTLGNAIKYIWRADLKHDDGGIEDLKKAQWYIEREIKRRTSESSA